MEAIPDEPVISIAVGLLAIFAAVLFLPFKFRKIEENLELFFLIMGVAAVTISGFWSLELIVEALAAPVMIGGIPIGIFQVVLIAGLLLYYFNKHLCRGIDFLAKKLRPEILIFSLITILSLCASIISVIATSVILAEVVTALPFKRRERINLTVITCFGIGLGAALTPIGEPLSTILVAKLAGPPYYASFLFLFTIVGEYLIPGIIAIAFFGALYIGRRISVSAGVAEDRLVYIESVRGVMMRAIKVYIFIAALILLGEGLTPLVIWYFTKIPSYGLYWVNVFSAVVDNATLTAAEIGPTLTIAQIKSITISLLVSGGMLIPGNIPNIVAAGRLKIKMKEWAVLGVPLGIVILIAYFLILIPVFMS